MMPDDPMAPAERTKRTFETAAVCLAVPAVALAYSFRFVSFLDAKNLVLSLFVATLAILGLVHGRFPTRGLRRLLPLWVLVGWTLVVHGALGAAEVPAYTVEAVVYGAMVLVFAAYAYDVQRQAQGREVVMLAFLTSAMIVALLGMLQFSGSLEMLFPVFPDYPQQMYSVFGNQDLLGGYLAIALPLLVYRALGKSKLGSLYIGAGMILVAAILLSGSRSAWLASLIGCGVAVYCGKVSKERMALGLGATVAIAVLVIAIAPDRTIGRVTNTFSAQDVGANARVWFWHGAARMTAAHPLIGVGPGNFKYWSPKFQGDALHAEGGEKLYQNDVHTLHAHSEPLDVSAETGIVGLALMAWFLWRLPRRKAEEWGGLAALAAFGLVNTFHHSAPHLIAGLLLAGAMMTRASEQSEPSVSGNAMQLRMAGASVLAVVGALGLVSILPSYGLSSARDVYENGGDALAHYQSLESSRWPAYSAALDHAALLLEEGREEDALEILDRAARGIDTWDLHYLRGVAAEGLGDPDTARSAYEAALHRWPRNVEAWNALLAVTPEQESVRERSARWVDREVL